MLTMELGGVSFSLETAAISCLRYRRDYGQSFPVALSRARTAAQVEGLLLRLCHTMLPEKTRPSLLDFAVLCRQDGDFFAKALAVKSALLAPDPCHEAKGKASNEDFDEYHVLALCFAAGMDVRLWWELPILHVLAVAEECFALRGEGEGGYQVMSQEEMTRLYPK